MMRRGLDANQALLELVATIANHPGGFGDWCCGVACEVAQKLRQHRVDPSQDIWAACECDTCDGAWAVEEELVQRGCETSDWPTPQNARWVYAYRMHERTREARVIRC